MPGKFAVNTDVPSARTLDEIRQTLKRYNATSFGLLEDAKRVGVAFEMQNRRVRFTMPIPQPNEHRTNSRGTTRTSAQINAAVEKARRSRWRALLLTIKAKLESIETGIETFEEAFMAQIVLPSGQTMSEWAVPQIEKAYAGGEMPPLLGSGER